MPAPCVLQPHWGMNNSQGRKLWFSLVSLDLTVTEENPIIYASLYVLERFTPLAGWPWSVHAGLTGCSMQLLYWDDFQSEPFDNGAVELTCHFGTLVTVVFLQGKGREGSQSDTWWHQKFHSLFFSASDGGLRLRDHSSSAGCLLVEVRTRKGNNRKSGLVCAVVNFWRAAFIFMGLFSCLSCKLLSFSSPSLPLSLCLSLCPTLAPSGSLLLQACASLWTCSWTPCLCWGTSFFSASLSSSSLASLGCSCGLGCSATAASWRRTSQCEWLGVNISFPSLVDVSLSLCLLMSSARLSVYHLLQAWSASVWVLVTSCSGKEGWAKTAVFFCLHSRCLG